MSETSGEEKTDGGQAEQMPLEDEEGPISYTVIGDSSLITSSGVDELCAGDETRLVHTVSYRGLTPQESYTLTSTVHLMDEDGTDLGPLADEDGNPVEASTDLQPQDADGSAELEIELPTALAEGSTLVACAQLVDATGTTVASQKASSSSMSVRVPSISTSATDAQTGCHTAPKLEGRSVVDVISYANLTPGREYVATGCLHAKATDGSDAGAVCDARGNDLTSETAFVPEKSQGTVRVVFSLDASALADSSVVVFERITCEGSVVARHEDIADAQQSISFAQMKTELVNASDGSKHASAGERLKDTVSYQGLIPGTTYTLVGTIHLRSQDGNDAGTLNDEQGKAITVRKELTPKAADGSETVEFVLPKSIPAGTSLVAFETLLEGEAIVLRHEDIASESQTVSVGTHTAAVGSSQGGTGERMPQTGRAPIGPLLIVVGALVFFVGLCVSLRKRGTTTPQLRSYRRRRHYVA